MVSNNAAWLLAMRAPLQVQAAPYTPPRDNELVVKNRAVAINPVDWLKQSLGNLMFSWIKAPFVLGSDLAGEVVEVGKDVTRFKVGDRVLGHAVGMDAKRNSAAEGAFQAYTVVLEHMASPIPDAMSFEAAAVLPLGLSTAACGLFQKDQLALAHPSNTPTSTGQTVLIWGGSTSVGSNAIQLAVAAGYEVITTASPKNFAYVKKLGASHAFDYKNPSVVSDVTAALRGKRFAGALAIGQGSAAYCLDIVAACAGKKFVSMASAPVAFDKVPEGSGRIAALFMVVLQMIFFGGSLGVKSLLRGIRTNFIFGTSLMNNEVSRAVYEDFLPRALASGAFAAAPEAHVIGRGLDQVQVAFDLQRQGMSAKKVVVSL